MAQVSEGRLEAATESFREACRLDESDHDACYYLSRALYASGRYTDAVEPFAKALRAVRKEDRWRVFRGMGRNHEALAEAPEAERCFREAMRLSRGKAGPDEDPGIDYGMFLFRAGRTEEALKPLGDAVRAHPASSRARAELGRVLMQADRLEDAARQLEKAIELDPKAWNARLLLGRAYVRLGRIEEGERELRLGAQGQGSSAAR